MLPFSKALEQDLLDLAWSLWTELGVAGVKRKHQNFLISLEELILLTVALEDVDPRLRDESLDWCSQYHHFVSLSRLKNLAKGFGSILDEPFSRYSATLNSISRAAWPLFVKASPMNISPSGKSCLRPLESPALLNIRARSLFGTGARADLVTFFLTHKAPDFSASDLIEIGYSKRNLAEILDELTLSGLFDKFLQKNQLRYRLIKRDQLVKALGSLPEYIPSWQPILEILLPLRACIKDTEKSSESTKVVEIRNILIGMENTLKRLKLTPPPFQADFHVYCNSFRKWLLELTHNLALGHFRQ